MKRLYVLTRKDLGLAYQAVQGAHAVAQFCIDYPNHKWNNGYLIFLEVEDYGDLLEWEGELNYQNDFREEKKKIPYSEFYETDLDIDNRLTAIAAYTNGTKFKKVPIMGSAPADEPEKPKPAPIRIIKEGESEPLSEKDTKILTDELANPKKPNRKIRNAVKRWWTSR